MMSCGGNVSLSSFEEKFDERRTTTFCHRRRRRRGEEEGAKNDVMESQSTEEN